ncbi:MAG TPA: GIY-YIG nuclease family protein [Gammaproteobacteria bacterium]|jgi:predicted GIY-YIG superfamily endonuclease|nr:GIY-YIG nuclease family protein [Gammaproteobacteria bacterium]
MADAPWHVYIVRCNDESLYTGVAKELDLRIAQHNAGVGAKYTRSRRPVTLVYWETAADRGAAQQREFAIKQLSPVAKRRLVQGAATNP